MRIDLFSITQTVLVVPRKTGIIYTNQVGGTECDHSELEGFVLPIEYDFRLDEPQASLTFKLSEMFPEGNPGVIEQREADEIQKLLNDSPFTKGIIIDWKKLDSSKESWVYVIVNGSFDGTIKPGEITEAILTWPNSD